MDLKKAQALIDYLKMYGVELVLAGGACRDIIHGCRPKDWDFFVLNQNDHKALTTTLRKAGFRFDYTGKYGEARGNPEYKGVFKSWLGADVDIILWENPVANAEEVVERFDLNLNQYWMEDGEIKFKEDAPHLTGMVEVLKDHGDAERTKRLLQKFPYNE